MHEYVHTHIYLHIDTHLHKTHTLIYIYISHIDKS